MPIPVNVIYNLLIFLCGVSVFAFIFSWCVTQGIKFQSCKGDGSCGCDNPHHEGKHGKTAKRILALLEKQ